MPDELIPADMGFAEFVAKLIDETFEAVARSLTEQDRRRAELRAAASLTLDEFATRVVADAQVEEFLASEFPRKRSKGGQRAHAGLAGAPYTPRADGVQETPPFGSRLGAALTSKHYKSSRAGTHLTRAGAKFVALAARAALAREQFESLRRAVTKGLPTVVIDHGKIHARLTFRAVRMEDAAKSRVKSRLISPLKPLGQLAGPHLSDDHLGSVRLVVSQANISAQPTGETVDVFGDIEITFKTIT